VFSLDAGTGRAMWKTKIDEQVSASAALADDIVITGGMFDGTLAGLDRLSGKILWSFKVRGGFDAGPVVSGDIAYVGSTDQYLYAVNVKTGEIVWKKLMKGMMRGSVAVADGVLYAGTQRGRVVAMTTAR
jgi:outer membrane protein assembly factor BamB